jgi:fructuronate reductase
MSGMTPAADRPDPAADLPAGTDQPADPSPGTSAGASDPAPADRSRAARRAVPPGPARAQAAQHRLSRATDGRPAAPVRIAHLGLGNFFRAHAAWYTDRAADADRWGIAAFAGRSGPPAGLIEQDGLYTLLVRDAEGDRPQVVSSISAVHGAADVTAWHDVLTLPDLAIVTSTVTEAGYCRAEDGGLDLDDARVRADLAALRSGTGPVATLTAPGRLVSGLRARRAAGLGGVSLVPCDNLPDNGAVVRRVVLDLARCVDPDLAGWIADTCGFVTTVVDRITPRTTDADRADVLAATGAADPACVVTEGWSEWVLSGEFVAGRPGWESAGARFVPDVEPWEHRKLWLLNGAHSLLAYAGPLRRHTTVAEAISDPELRGWVEQWWDEAGPSLPLPADEVQAYREALLRRFADPHVRHLLAQIAADGSQKLPVRIVPVLRSAAWTLHLRGTGAPVADEGAASLREAVRDVPLPDAVHLVLATLGVSGGGAARGDGASDGSTGERRAGERRESDRRAGDGLAEAVLAEACALAR